MAAPTSESLSETRSSAAHRFCAPRARALDENLPHRSRGDADEVPLVVPRRAGARQPQIRLVHERGRLQRLPRPLAPHVGGREAAQLVIDPRREVMYARCDGPSGR